MPHRHTYNLCADITMDKTLTISQRRFFIVALPRFTLSVLYHQNNNNNENKNSKWKPVQGMTKF